MSAAFVKLKKDEIFMQKAKPGRGQRVAEQIARDLAEIIPLEVRDPRVGLVTITGGKWTSYRLMAEELLVSYNPYLKNPFFIYK